MQGLDSQKHLRMLRLSSVHKGREGGKFYIFFKQGNNNGNIKVYLLRIKKYMVKINLNNYIRILQCLVVR